MDVKSMSADLWRPSKDRNWQKLSKPILSVGWDKLTSSALFIEPKWAQFLQSSGVTEAMGKPMAIPTKAQRDQGAFERVV
jgi:hypothetical protein